jgi:penicillin-insensitive murein DD-endopeptidase
VRVVRISLMLVMVMGVVVWVSEPDASATRSTAKSLFSKAISSSSAKVTPAIHGSVGAPNHGKLAGGVCVKKSATIMPVRSACWGVPNLVTMLVESSEAVAKQFPSSVLLVGDLSKKNGGDIAYHRSHESGRDADVAFYLRDQKNPDHALSSRVFAKIKPDGSISGHPTWRFDEARNWALVESWLVNKQAKVTQIFVADYLKKTLLAYAQKAKRPLEIQRKAASVLQHPKNARVHDNHFHVRISCPRSGTTRCLENPVRTSQSRQRMRNHHSWVPGRRKREGNVLQARNSAHSVRVP